MKVHYVFKNANQTSKKIFQLKATEDVIKIPRLENRAYLDYELGILSLVEQLQGNS